MNCRIILNIGAMLCGCFSFGIVNAAPLYYTFEGTISSINNTNGLIDPALAKVGDPIEQVWLIDVDADGTSTYTSQYVQTKVDTASQGWFYTDFYRGLNFETPGSGAPTNNIAEYNAGYTMAGQTTLVGNSGKEQSWLRRTDTVITAWAIGMGGFWGYQFLFVDGDTKTDRWLSDNLALKSI